MYKTYCDWCGKEDPEDITIKTPEPESRKVSLSFSYHIPSPHICFKCLLQELRKQEAAQQ